MYTMLYSNPMQNNCEKICPVYAECISRIQNIAVAQAAMHASLNAPNAQGPAIGIYNSVSQAIVIPSRHQETFILPQVDETDSGEIFDPFRAAVLGEIAVTSALQNCDGPRISAFQSAVRLQYAHPVCSSKAARAGLALIPKIKIPRSD